MATPKLRFKEFSKDWGSKKIIELADYVDYRGKTPKKVESGVLLVTAKNIKQGYLDYSASQEFIEESAFDDVMRRGKVELNDVLITTEAPLGNVASVDRTDIALAQRVIKYRGKVGLLDNLFLKQKFLSESFQEILKSKATGGTVQGIKGSVLHQIPLIVPSKEEQTKIASFLSAVDEKISQLTQKHELLSQYKQGMMQKLFSQQIRFKADDGSEFGEWEQTLLSEFLTESLIKGLKGNEAKKLTVKLWGKGVVPKNEVFEGSENTQYYKRFVGQLIYGKLDFLNCAFGIIPTHLDGYETTIDAPSFDINKEKANPYFLLNRFLQKDFYKKNGEEADGSRKAKRINQSVFLAMQIDLPCLAEQTKIANFLSAIDQKIEVVAQEIEQAKQWKKGLLQQMFV
jgi:type I restriction enzyme S subunit